VLRVLVTLFALVSAATPFRIAAAAGSDALQKQSCTIGKKKAPAECGSLRVFENRAAKSGRTIRIHFILLKAPHPNGRAIYVNLGGPASELGEVSDVVDQGGLLGLDGLRDRYDILFVDERGFGESHRLGCDLSPTDHPETYFAALYPEALLISCRKVRSTQADLSQYNTPMAADDIDDLRAALGYDKLIFDTGSYGTFTAFVYVRRHPERVESAVLMSVDPPAISNEARNFAHGAEVSLDRLAADCDRDTLCSKKYPDFRRHFFSLLARFDSGPVPVKVTNASTGRLETVGLSRQVFVDAVRHALYSPEGASYVPLVIDRAYRGDTVPLGQLVVAITQNFASSVDNGAFLSYTCSELMPSTDSPADLQYAKSTSWFGVDRVLAQQRACAVWDVPKQPAAFFTPVRSSVPILMISGADDPATPPQEGRAELQYLSDARQMLVLNAPHDVDSPCVDRTIDAFIRAGSWEGLDLSSCKGTFKRPPFATTWPPSQ
jgi:pimeloyl-ACP methyl ester carboxylesterase